MNAMNDYSIETRVQHDDEAPRTKKTGVLYMDGDAREMALKMQREIAQTTLCALGFEDVKASWSQKAGCSCGCSPGFVLRGPGVARKNIWATVKK